MSRFPSTASLAEPATLAPPDPAVRLDLRMLLALQALVLGLPLLLGGHHPWALALGCPLILGLLALTIRERGRRSDAPATPGLAALAAFVALGFATTVPLLPSVVAFLSPATARLYAETLPGWPGDGGWSVWRPLALDPYGVWVELGRLSLALGTFAVVIAHPWRLTSSGEGGRERAFERLLITLIAGGAVLSALALVQEVLGLPIYFWVDDTPAHHGRAAGPFVNPNHFAGWLEMVIPIGLAYGIALGGRLRKRLRRAVGAGKKIGVRARRARITALIAHQRRLWAPMIAAVAVVVMAAAHVATGSRGGTAALLVGLAIATGGIAARAWPRGREARLRRLAPAAIALLLTAGSAASFFLWAASEGDSRTAGTVETLDVDLGSRLAVAFSGSTIVRDFPLFGTGLGSWLHAFRPYQAPPVDSGIWDHAHNDYLELAAESGLAGVACVLVFGALVVLGLRRREGEPFFALGRHGAGGLFSFRRREGSARDGPGYDLPSTRSRLFDHGGDRPVGFELPEWRAALGERAVLEWGLVGGVAAILVHSLVDFGLRMPANLTLAMVVLALVVLAASTRRAANAWPDLQSSPARSSWALITMLVVFGLAAAPRFVNLTSIAVGGPPIAASDCLAAADLALAEGGEEGRYSAIALARRALDRSPADREAHEMLATALGPGPAAEDALRRALALEPWSPEVRDRLALAMWNRGAGEPDAGGGEIERSGTSERGGNGAGAKVDAELRARGARELEEAIFRFPYLVSHAYLSLGEDLGIGTREGDLIAARDAAQLIRALADGDTMIARLAALEPEMVAAIERGLTRALGVTPAGPWRASIVSDLVMLLEARERWADAAAVLRAEAERTLDGGGMLARAARDYLKAGDPKAAEQALLTALLRNPEQGDLYRDLAVHVYAARGDFPAAENVLDAGQNQAVDRLPVYEGVTQVLARRESARFEEYAEVAPTVMRAVDASVVEEDGEAAALAVPQEEEEEGAAAVGAPALEDEIPSAGVGEATEPEDVVP